LSSSSAAGSVASESSFVFYGVFIAEEVNGVQHKRSADTTTVDAQTLLGGFLNMSMTSACFINDTFLVKSKISGLGK
jgi:hypothetical protein